MDGLDLTVWPCHPKGSWQRALAHRCAGLPVDDADAEALAKWDSHPATLNYDQSISGMVSKSMLLRQEQKVIGAVIDAATTVLDLHEVVGTHELARRIAGMPGVPNYARTTSILKATGTSNHEAHRLQGGNTRRRMYKRYIDNLSGKPGHFFTRRIDNFDKFIAERKAYRRAIGDRMKDNLQLRRRRKKESLDQ